MKLKTEENSKVWFSSDFHLGHNKPFVWEKRGHKNVDECTDYIISTLNERIRPEDKLFFLGDFCLNTKESRFEEYLSRIQCQNIYMLWGNHANPSRSIYKREISGLIKSQDHFEIYPFRYRNVVFMGDYAEISVDGKYFILSHYPIHSWNMMSSGSIHLFGHMHCQNSPETGLRMDVGWDKHKRPYSFDDIKGIMANKKIKEVDHHVNEKS